MKQHLLTIGIWLTVVWGLPPPLWPTAPVDLSAQTAAPAPDRPAYRFAEIAGGVYFASGTGAMTVMSNSLVIVNDDHVMLVDTSVTPAAARALISQVHDELTDKPIRYVFNSHYHFDRAHGNQVLGEDVEIIGHDYVRQIHLSNVLEQRTNRSFTVGIPGQIEQMRKRLAVSTDPEERERLQADLRVREAHWNAIQETNVTPPNVTYSDTMTIHKSGREVQLHFLGRGHTAGDTMIFLPAERIVFTGDFLLGRPGGGILSYMGDGFVNEWPDSLQRLKAIDFDVIVPGHGAPFRDRGQIDTFQAYLGDLWAQVSKLRADGLSVEEAVGRVDMSQYADRYGPRVGNVDPRAVIRIYELLQIQMPM